MAEHVTLELYPAAAQRGRLLTAFPLLSREPVDFPYLLLADAITAGSLTLAELGQGSVPELVATNAGRTDVLVLDGEQLVGAMQDRMASRSVLLPGKRETRIPVSCIERGRWRFDSRDFRPSSQHSPGRVRRKVRDLEARLVREKTVCAGDLLQAQSAVWSEIGVLSEGLRVHSPTDALDGVSDTVRPRIEDEMGRFPRTESQVGLLAFAGGTPLGLDVVGACAVYARVHERLLRGHLLDALAAREASPAERAAGVDEADALRFLALVGAATRTEATPVGRGRYLVLSDTVVGAELIDGHRLVHRSAYPLQPAGSR